jgi:hypothetical protein
LVISPAREGRVFGGTTIIGTRMPPSPMNHFHHCKLPLAAPAQSVPMKSKVFPWPMSSNSWLKQSANPLGEGRESSPRSPNAFGTVVRRVDDQRVVEFAGLLAGS